jgi:hypothetical protein
MPGVTAGVYTGSLDAGTEVSSTYEGRHLTVYEAELIHPYHADGFVDKGEPVVLCDSGVPTTYGLAVGVAFNSAAAATDLIALDTEGIWNLTVYAEDDDGDRAIEIGDRLYIRCGALAGAADADGTGDAEISKISNTVVQIPFGYALGSVVAGGSGVIAVKVHFGDELMANIANKGLDHVKGTTTDPIAWGTTGNHLESTVFTVGILTDYINGMRQQMLTTGDITAGGVYNYYTRQDIQHGIQNMIGVHALEYFHPATAADETINQILGISGQCYLLNPGKTITLTDQIACIRATMDQDATSAITPSEAGVNGKFIGVSVYMNGLLHDNEGDSIGIQVDQGGGGTSYPDYGLRIRCESANALAGIRLEQLAVNGGYGIDIEDSGGFYYTSLIRYDGVNANGYFLQLTAAAGVEDSAIPFDTATCGETADMRLRVRCVGDATVRYIYLYPI